MPTGFEIDFLPVGDKSCSGDAICIRYGTVESGYSIHVVDGGYATTTQSITDHLDSYYGRPRHIDHIVLTHADGDHASGLLGVLENYSVGALWMNRPWLYAEEIVHNFHANWTVDGLRRHLRAAFPTLVALEDLANGEGDSDLLPASGRSNR